MTQLKTLPPKLKLLIRADAGTRMGSGHVMRCLALAQAWQDDGGTVTFAVHEAFPAAPAERLQAEGITVQRFAFTPGSPDDAHQTVSFAHEMNALAVVIDGYHFDSVYQKILKKAGLKILFLDDNGHADHYAADFVLNQNIHATESLYPERELDTRLLLGTKYILLRREFRQFHNMQSETPVVARKILVTMGGGDPDNVTQTVLEALKTISVDSLEIAVVVGGSNPHYDELETLARKSPHRIHLKRNVTRMPELMAWADIAISAGGTTVWELAYMGIPTLLIIIADNQEPSVQECARQNRALNMGWFHQLSRQKIAETVTSLLNNPTLRAEITTRARIDGRGVERVIGFLKDEKFRLRPARQEDCMLLWQWVNDSMVRQMAFSSVPIPWKSHQIWFEKKLQSPDSYLFIALDNHHEAVGQIRFDALNHTAAEIDISVAQDFRGKGYGTQILRLATSLIFDDTEFQSLHATVKINNPASAKAFEKAGFRQMGQKTIHGTPCFLFELTRETNDPQ